jgi:hypothetical protein
MEPTFTELAPPAMGLTLLIAMMATGIQPVDSSESKLQHLL